MLTSPLGLRIFVALEPLDMREHFDGLAGAAALRSRLPLLQSAQDDGRARDTSAVRVAQG